MRHIFLVPILFCTATLFAQLPVPELWGVRVHDDAKVLSAQIVHHIETQLKEFEDSTSNQIAILIIPTLDGEAIEDYTLRVAEKWKLGQKEKDNGVILLIAIDDRKMRFEVGYGLEGVLTDAVCSQIIRNEMAPHFRRGDYDGGVDAAVNSIILTIGGEYTVDPGSGDNIDLPGEEKALIGLFLFIVLGIFTFTGISIPGSPGWGIYFFLIPFYAVFPGAIFGWNVGLTILGIYLISFPILKMLFKKIGWTEKMRKIGSGGRSWSPGSGWSSSSRSGWSSGGGSSFSGGGGSFGGGGSSGSW